MAKTKANPKKISFSNASLANEDLFQYSEDDVLAQVLYLHVSGNDPGGKAKVLYSVDDGTNADGSTSSDLLQQDDIDVVNYSAMGARIWITSDGKVAYDASALNIDALSEGQTLTDTFTYAVRMTKGLNRPGFVGGHLV